MPVRIHTFLYTDLVGSTPDWERNPVAMRERVERHNAIVSEQVQAHGGRVFKSLGDGLANVFETAHEALRAAYHAQAGCAREGLQVRMGVHSGPAEEGALDYQGHALNRVARLCGMAVSDQVLVSQACRELAIDLLEPPLELLPGGTCLPKGVSRPEPVFRLSGPDLDGGPMLPSLARTNLVPYTGTFFGREAERSRLHSLLRDPGQRVTTVLGFGGIGKTTLARVVAADLAEEFPAGRWWVDCEALQSRQDLIAAVASAAGWAVDPYSPLEGLARPIGDERVLLVLDCFEGIADLADVVDALVVRCPRLQILVTSRVVLGLRIETELELRGLDGRRGSSVPRASMGLFEDAARRVLPTFRASGQNRKLVRKIVEALEHVPLALVIAAGRLRHITLEELCQQVEESLLRTVQSPSAPQGRHAGLRQVIDASYRLLPEPDRKAAAALSVFVGGFRLSEAASVLPNPLDSVSRLRDHSLLNAEAAVEGSRYRALDSVREYFQEMLPAEERSRLLSLHAAAYAPVAKELRRRFDEGDLEGAARLNLAEHGNLRLALHSLSATGAKEAISFAASVARPWLEAGWLEDFRMAADVASASEDPRVRTDVLGLMSSYARRTGDLERALELQRIRAEQITEQEARHEAWVELAIYLVDLGRADEASQVLAQVPDNTSTATRACVLALQAGMAASTDSRETAEAALEAATRAALALPPGMDRLFPILRSLEAALMLRATRTSLVLGSTLLEEGLRERNPRAAGRALCALVVATRSTSPSLATAALQAARAIPAHAEPSLEERIEESSRGVAEPEAPPRGATWWGLSEGVLARIRQVEGDLDHILAESP